MTTITQGKRYASNNSISGMRAGKATVSMIIVCNRYHYLILYFVMAATLTSITVDWVRLRAFQYNHDDHDNEQRLQLFLQTRPSSSTSKLSLTKKTARRTMTTRQYKSLSQSGRKDNKFDEDIYDAAAATLTPTKNYADNDLLTQPYVDYHWLRRNNPRMSPYEIRYPYDQLPYWAKKTKTLVRRPLPPEDKAVCFVHLGKTGGSTIGCCLGFRTNCGDGDTTEEEQRQPQQKEADDHDENDGREETDLSKKAHGKGILPLFTTNMIHNGVNDCADDMPYYLFTLRDPLERIQSAYVYDRRAVHVDAAVEYPNDDYYIDRGQMSLYVECPFYTLNDLAMRGLAKDGPAPEHCKRRARDTIKGTQRAGYHLYYNHNWFLNATNALKSSSKSKILVIRLKHMVDDWNSAEDILSVGGGGESTGKTKRRMESMPSLNEGGKKTPKLYDDQHLSSEARTLLCEALCTEIRLYKRILNAALNLSPEDKRNTLNELSQSCPTIANVETCDDYDEV